MSKQWIAIGCGCAIIVGMVGFALLGVLALFVLAAEPNTAAEVTAAPTITAMMLTTPTDIPSPTETPIPFEDQLADMEGIEDLRNVNVTPFGDSYIVLLELDVESGYNILATARVAYQLTLDFYGAPDMEFSVVLWDKSNPATNYTWDRAAGIWRATSLTSPP